MAARSLAARATLAVLLRIGFYLLALVVAAFLVFLPYAEARWADLIHFQLTFFCLAGAGIVLWSAIPKRDTFSPPGPLLRRDEQPRLFGQIDSRPTTGSRRCSTMFPRSAPSCRTILVPQALACSKPARWEEGSPGYLKLYGDSSEPYATAFAGVAIEELAARREAIVQAMQELQRRTRSPAGTRRPKSACRTSAGSRAARSRPLRGSAALPLHDTGLAGTLRGPRGDLDPFKSMKQIVEGEMFDDAWRARCAELGLSGAPLGILAAPA